METDKRRLRRLLSILLLGPAVLGGRPSQRPLDTLTFYLGAKSEATRRLRSLNRLAKEFNVGLREIIHMLGDGKLAVLDPQQKFNSYPSGFLPPPDLDGVDADVSIHLGPADVAERRLSILRHLAVGFSMSVSEMLRMLADGELVLVMRPNEASEESGEQ
jgi:hypothetical protein